MKLEQQRQEESSRRIQQAQAAEKQSKMEKAKQVTQEALRKQQEIKAQQSLFVQNKPKVEEQLINTDAVGDSSSLFNAGVQPHTKLDQLFGVKIAQTPSPQTPSPKGSYKIFSLIF